MLSNQSIFIKKKSDFYEIKEKNTSNPCSSWLLQLPNDSLLVVLFYLTGLDAITFGNTSTQTRAIAHNKPFWQTQLHCLTGDFELNDDYDHHPKRHVLNYLEYKKKAHDQKFLFTTARDNSLQAQIIFLHKPCIDTLTLEQIKQILLSVSDKKKIKEQLGLQIIKHMDNLSTDQLILKFEMGTIGGQVFLHHLGAIAPTIAISLLELIQKDEHIIDAIPLLDVMIDFFRCYYAHNSEFICYIASWLTVEEEAEEEDLFPTLGR